MGSQSTIRGVVSRHSTVVRQFAPQFAHDRRSRSCTSGPSVFRKFVMTTLELLRESFGAGTIFSPFYTESLFTDIILVAAGDPTLTFKVHRVVLSAASPYLARKIRGYKDTEGPLVLPYIRFNTLKAILDYIYHGRVTIRADDAEDFHSFRRMFEVELGHIDGARAVEGEAQSGPLVQNAPKRNLLLRGDGPIALKKERLEVNRLRGVKATQGTSPI